MEFNPFYVGSDDEEEGFNNNEADRSENNKSLNSLNNCDGVVPILVHLESRHI